VLHKDVLRLRTHRVGCVRCSTRCVGVRHHIPTSERMTHSKK
jgi:hypothetical protein